MTSAWNEFLFSSQKTLTPFALAAVPSVKNKQVKFSPPVLAE